MALIDRPVALAVVLVRDPAPRPDVAGRDPQVGVVEVCVVVVAAVAVRVELELDLSRGRVQPRRPAVPGPRLAVLLEALLRLGVGDPRAAGVELAAFDLPLIVVATAGLVSAVRQVVPASVPAPGDQLPEVQRHVLVQRRPTALSGEVVVLPVLRAGVLGAPAPVVPGPATGRGVLEAVVQQQVPVKLIGGCEPGGPHGHRATKAGQRRTS